MEQAPENGTYFRLGDPGDLAKKLVAIWERSSTGVQPEREKATRATGRENGPHFARTFLGIAAEALNLPGTGA